MFCRMRFFLIIMMSFAVMTAAAQEITDIVDIAEPTVNAEILTVSSDIGYITFYDADESKHNGRVGMDIPLQSTIVTEEAQRMECVIRRDGKPVVGLTLNCTMDEFVSSRITKFGSKPNQNTDAYRLRVVTSV